MESLFWVEALVEPPRVLGQRGKRGQKTWPLLIQKRRRRLDRNMIGEPMNFVHNAHVGTREMSSDFSSTASIQDHMKSKGGYTNGTSATAEL
nr:CDC42 small effector protein 2-B-like isoform X1 [Anser cygnoides]